MAKKHTIEKEDYHGFFTRPLDWNVVEKKIPAADEWNYFRFQPAANHINYQKVRGTKS